jgi:hypothetical protein
MVGIAFLNKQNFTFSLHDENFIRDLPSYIEFDEDIYNKLIKIKNIENELAIYDVVQWSIQNKTRESFWIVMKPLINKVLKETFIKNNLVKKIEYPVIHFRCSDIPFNRHNFYHFQKYKFFSESLNEISKNIKFDKVILISCHSHLSNASNLEKCDIYLQSLKKHIESLGYEVIMKCNDTIDDFASIFYAPAVISTPSSYSFMSGFFGDGIFISEGHYIEDVPNTTCLDCEPWLKNGYSINHKQVADYYDTDNVIKLLNE